TVATMRTTDGALRGITLTAVMPLSLDPPLVAFALAEEGEFRQELADAGRCCVQILNRDDEFISERFAARAPLPDAKFTGIPHELIDDIPVLNDPLARVIGEVERIDPGGDHVLVILRVTSVS